MSDLREPDAAALPRLRRGDVSQDWRLTHDARPYLSKRGTFSKYKCCALHEGLGATYLSGMFGVRLCGIAVHI